MKTVFFLLTFFMIVSIPESANAQDKDMDKKKEKVYTTENGQRYIIVGWEADVVYSPYSYTYVADIDPILAKKDPTLLRVEFDRPPLFGSECLMASNQKECTNEKIQKFASENIEYPDPASEEFQEGLEYVTFTLDENGEYEGEFEVLSKDDPCRGCEEKAVEMISQMEDEWYPALQDGKPVKTKITIPVKFDLINK